MISIAVLGYGTVGSGVVDVVKNNCAQIKNTLGDDVKVKYVLDIREFENLPELVHDINIILNDPDIKIVCETMGGKKPAFEFTKSALERGISVCTSNKELVDAHGVELSNIARENNCSYLFEASVGGGIPILRALREACGQEKITAVIGILNGTCNYILTKMKSGVDFEDALKEAQEKGFAERNPSADVEGHDTARKIAILASLVSGKRVSYENIVCEGITGITARDFKYAEKLSMSVKLLGLFEPENKFILTAPFLIPSEHALYNINGVFNGILIRGNMVDDLMFYGRGAGKLPTASAVVADVIECARENKNIPNGLSPEILKLGDINNRSCKFFVRVNNKAKALENFNNITEIDCGFDDEFAFITEPMTGFEFDKKISDVGLKNKLRLLS